MKGKDFRMKEAKGVGNMSEAQKANKKRDRLYHKKKCRDNKKQWLNELSVEERKRILEMCKIRSRMYRESLLETERAAMKRKARLSSKTQAKENKKKKIPKIKDNMQESKEQLQSTFMVNRPPQRTQIYKIGNVKKKGAFSNKISLESYNKIKEELEVVNGKLKIQVQRNKTLRKRLQRFGSTVTNDTYKYLKSIGLHQILSATKWTSTPYEEVQKEARMHYDKIRIVTSTLEDEFDKIIKEKLNGAFRATVKQEIIKFIGLNNNEDAEIGVMDVEEVNRVEDIKVEVAESDNEDKKIEGRKSNGGALQSASFMDEISLDSLSSVHTSDLSSFDDEISISSEEGNEKRRVSIKFAEEELKRVKENKIQRKHSEDEQEITIKTENGEQTKSQSSGSLVSQSSSPRRTRKPNKKYFSNDVLSPFDVDFDIKVINTTAVPPPTKSQNNTDAPRKRGRPKKYTSD